MRSLQPVAVCLLVLALAGPVSAQAPAWRFLTATPTVSQPTEAERLLGELDRLDVIVEPLPLVTGNAVRGDLITVSLPGGEMTYRVSRITSYLPGITSLAAMSEDGSGGMVAVSITADGPVGAVTAGAEEYYLIRDGGGEPRLVLVDSAEQDHLQCGVSDAEEDADHGALLLTEGDGLQLAAPEPGVHMRALADASGIPLTIDLMIAYTPMSAAWAQTSHLGSIENVIAQSMARSQLVLDNSGVDITLRLVHAFEVDYPETGSSVLNLQRLTASPDFNPFGPNAAGYMEEVHVRREQWGADLVTLFADGGDFGGVAWLLDRVGGQRHMGFSVNRVQQVATSYTLIHELGHNMGSHHGRDQILYAAGPGGGLFPYSTGWRWTGTSGAKWFSVMSYGRDGDTAELPYLSNPDIIVDGMPSGDYHGPYAPADNARSFREAKLAVASYSPTRLDPPVIAVAASDLTVTIDAGAVATRTVAIGNAGASDLTWTADLVVSFNGDLDDMHRAFAEVTADLPAALEMPGAVASHAVNISPIEAARANGDMAIYQTSFEAAQGFPLGVHDIVEMWSNPGNQMRVSSENPSDGSQHLRIPADTPITGASVVDSPYFGPWSTGAYEFAMDVAVSATGGSTYHLTFSDGITGDWFSGMVFTNSGALFLWSPTSGYIGTGLGFTPGAYQRLMVSIDPANSQVTFALDYEQIGVLPRVGATSFGRLRIQRSAGGGTDFIDIDNISYVSAFRGLGWAEVDRYAGSVVPGGEQIVALGFDATSLTPGTYSAELVLRSNDPAGIEQRLPVVMNVTGPISTNDEPARLETRLLGVHPNPSRTTTTVQFILGEPGTVQLEVISVTGQRVALLVDEIRSSGSHDVVINTSSFANGMYLLRLRAGEIVESARLLVIR
jgi:hypothetical protein